MDSPRLEPPMPLEELFTPRLLAKIRKDSAYDIFTPCELIHDNEDVGEGFFSWTGSEDINEDWLNKRERSPSPVGSSAASPWNRSWGGCWNSRTPSPMARCSSPVRYSMNDSSPNRTPSPAGRSPSPIAPLLRSVMSRDLSSRLVRSVIHESSPLARRFMTTTTNGELNILPIENGVVTHGEEMNTPRMSQWRDYNFPRNDNGEDLNDFPRYSSREEQFNTSPARCNRGEERNNTVTSVDGELNHAMESQEEVNGMRVLEELNIYWYPEEDEKDEEGGFTHSTEIPRKKSSHSLATKKLSESFASKKLSESSGKKKGGILKGGKHYGRMRTKESMGSESLYKKRNTGSLHRTRSGSLHQSGSTKRHFSSGNLQQSGGLDQSTGLGASDSRAFPMKKNLKRVVFGNTQTDPLAASSANLAASTGNDNRCKSLKRQGTTTTHHQQETATAHHQQGTLQHSNSPLNHGVASLNSARDSPLNSLHRMTPPKHNNNSQHRTTPPKKKQVVFGKSKKVMHYNPSGSNKKSKKGKKQESPTLDQEFDHPISAGSAGSAIHYNNDMESGMFSAFRATYMGSDDDRATQMAASYDDHLASEVDHHKGMDNQIGTTEEISVQQNSHYLATDNITISGMNHQSSGINHDINLNNARPENDGLKRSFIRSPKRSLSGRKSTRALVQEDSGEIEKKDRTPSGSDKKQISMLIDDNAKADDEPLGTESESMTTKKDGKIKGDAGAMIGKTESDAGATIGKIKSDAGATIGKIKSENKRNRNEKIFTPKPRVCKKLKDDPKPGIVSGIPLPSGAAKIAEVVQKVKEVVRLDGTYMGESATDFIRENRQFNDKLSGSILGKLNTEIEGSADDESERKDFGEITDQGLKSKSARTLRYGKTKNKAALWTGLKATPKIAIKFAINEKVNNAVLMTSSQILEHAKKAAFHSKKMRQSIKATDNPGKMDPLGRTTVGESKDLKNSRSSKSLTDSRSVKSLTASGGKRGLDQNDLGDGTENDPEKSTDGIVVAFDVDCEKTTDSRDVGAMATASSARSTRKSDTCKVSKVLTSSRISKRLSKFWDKIAPELVKETVDSLVKDALLNVERRTEAERKARLNQEKLDTIEDVLRTLKEQKEFQIREDTQKMLHDPYYLKRQIPEMNKRWNRLGYYPSGPVGVPRSKVEYPHLVSVPTKPTAEVVAAESTAEVDAEAALSAKGS